MWWIKAAIQEYILRSWSLVKMGTTANQKRLFFNLRKAKSQIQALDEGDLRPDQVKQIATKLNVSEEEVVSMNRRLSGDASLNAPIRATRGRFRRVAGLARRRLPRRQETVLAERDELDQRRAMLKDALGVLDKRERRIFEARRLADDPLTLEQLSEEFDVSRERVRQLEVRAFEKVQKAMQKATRDRDRGRTALMAPACLALRAAGRPAAAERAKHAPVDDDQAEPDQEHAGGLRRA